MGDGTSLAALSPRANFSALSRGHTVLSSPAGGARNSLRGDFAFYAGQERARFPHLDDTHGKPDAVARLLGASLVKAAHPEQFVLLTNPTDCAHLSPVSP